MELESPIEKVQEHIHEAAHEAGGEWLRWCALLTALLAVMAAVSGLIASGYESDAMLEQIKASDQWSFYQAKSIKGLVVESQIDMMKHLQNDGKPLDTGEESQKLAIYKTDGEAIKVKAEELDSASEAHMKKHETMSRAVTCFQVAIAIIAIVVLTKRRRFIALSVALALAGFFFFAMGL